MQVQEDIKCPICKGGLILKSDYYEAGLFCKSCNSVFGIIDRQELINKLNIKGKIIFNEDEMIKQYCEKNINKKIINASTRRRKKNYF